MLLHIYYPMKKMVGKCGVRLIAVEKILKVGEMSLELSIISYLK